MFGNHLLMVGCFHNMHIHEIELLISPSFLTTIENKLNSSELANGSPLYYFFFHRMNIANPDTCSLSETFRKSW